MKNKALLSDLEMLCKIKGTAQVTVMLNFRDQRTIERWFKQKRIPQVRVSAVKHLVERELK
jgi:hypothetical protein